jgi:hypothetical protein
LPDGGIEKRGLRETKMEDEMTRHPTTAADIEAQRAELVAEQEKQRKRQRVKPRDGELLEPQWKGWMKHVPRVEVVRRGR